MAASIHISGTGSSVVDTIFVCRATTEQPAHQVPATPASVAATLRLDCDRLREGGWCRPRGTFVAFFTATSSARPSGTCGPLGTYRHLSKHVWLRSDPG
jgi:hypothetical protein